jgi:hypothetical protein
VVDGHGLFLALDADAVQLQPHKARRLRARAFAGNDLDSIGLAQPFQAGTEVDRIADDGVAAAHVGAHVAHAHGAGVEPHPHADGGQALRLVFGIDRVHSLHHVQCRLHRQVCMVGSGHGGAPEGHDAVAHVFVDGSALLADDMGESAEQGVEQGLQLHRLHALGQGGETADVAEHHRQLTHGRLHAVALGLAHHFIHQLGRHVGTKQMGQSALGAAFHKIAVAHVQGKGQQHHHQDGGQGKHQAVGQKQPQIQTNQGRKHRGAQCQCGASPHPRQQQPQQQAGDGNLRQVKAQSVIRLHWALPIQKAGDEVGVCLHARIGAPHRRSAQILQPRRRGAHQHHLVPQLRGRELAPQHVGCRDIG